MNRLVARFRQAWRTGLFGSNKGSNLPKLPEGYSFVLDADGNYITYQETVYSDPAYLVTRTL